MSGTANECDSKDRAVRFLQDPRLCIRNYFAAQAYSGAFGLLEQMLLHMSQPMTPQ